MEALKEWRMTNNINEIMCKLIKFMQDDDTEALGTIEVSTSLKETYAQKSALNLSTNIDFKSNFG